MLENDNKLVVAVITDNADVPSSSAPNTKARRGKVPTPSVTFATPELESSPVDIPQTTETQESFSLTEDIWPIMKQINECRMKNADTLNIPGQLVKVERLSSNSGKWKTRFIAETGSVPTLGVEPKNLGRTLDSKPLKATVARVWPPGNNYRPDVVLLSYPDVRHKFIAIVRDNLDDSVLFRHPHSNRETPDQALHRLDREIEKKFPPGKGVTPLPPPRRPKDIKYYTRVLKEEQILRMCPRSVMRV
ncbi:hypothetical protein J4E81_008415 [Alternaria sp. BMP 2799]|nr:hypothetical protein J4E81_008415 [Alternaria sp. BMP 2799]